VDDVTYGLFLVETEEHTQVWYCGREGEPEEQRYLGPWPLRVWFTAVDFLEGYGWGRSEFEEHAEVVEHYDHDVGNGDETQAVLGEVSSEETLVALVAAGFELWEGSEPPEQL
jgi:hypothetical protein